jgi:hypothetical protein
MNPLKAGLYFVACVLAALAIVFASLCTGPR